MKNSVRIIGRTTTPFEFSSNQMPKSVMLMVSLLQYRRMTIAQGLHSRCNVSIIRANPSGHLHYLEKSQ